MRHEQQGQAAHYARRQGLRGETEAMKYCIRGDESESTETELYETREDAERAGAIAFGGRPFHLGEVEEYSLLEFLPSPNALREYVDTVFAKGPRPVGYAWPNLPDEAWEDMVGAMRKAAFVWDLRAKKTHFVVNEALVPDKRRYQFADEPIAECAHGLGIRELIYEADDIQSIDMDAIEALAIGETSKEMG